MIIKLRKDQKKAIKRMWKHFKAMSLWDKIWTSFFTILVLLTYPLYCLYDLIRKKVHRG
jgi:hypothetical protein